jgi:PHD/YefM family antitoxin component YafN of YafNO toxin-antitoxin module
MSEKISEAAIDYGMAKTSLQQPLILERGGQPLAVLISFEEYQRLQSIATDEMKRRQMAWRELNEFLSGIHRHPTAYSPAEIEAEITAAREETKENRRGHRRSH